MRRTYKYRLYPNREQLTALEVSLETHRRIYNDALAERKEAYENGKKCLRPKDQYPVFSGRRNGQIADEKAGGSGPHFLAHVAAVSMRDTLVRLDLAFESFFRRVKAGKKPGYPRFRGRDRYNSIPFNNYNSGCAVVDRSTGKPMSLGDDLSLPCKWGYLLKMFGVGRVKILMHRAFRGKIKTVTVLRECDKWYVCLSCDLGEVDVPISTNPAAGVDVGISSFYTTSDGYQEPNPQYLKKSLPELKVKQKSASRKYKKGKRTCDQSRRWRKAQKRVAKLHEKVKNCRKEHHHKASLKLVRRYGAICVEKLDIKGMLEDGKYSRSVADAGWAGFVQTLKCKAESAGVLVVEVDPRGTTQECSGCGEVVPKTIRDRVHDCPHCGLVLDRDVNAARNILDRGTMTVVPVTTSPGRTVPAGVNVTSLPASAGKGKRRPRSTTTSRRETSGGNHGVTETQVGGRSRSSQ